MVDCFSASLTYNMAAFITEYLTAGNILSLLVCVLLLHFIYEFYQFRDMPPGPRFTNLPFIGNLLSFDLKADDFPNAIASIRRKYGRVLSLKVGSCKLVIAGTPEAVKEVLVTRSADYSGRPQLYYFITMTLGGKDILFGNGNLAWKHHRRIFVSALRQYVSNIPLIQERLDKSTQKLLNFFEKENGKSFDPGAIVGACITDVISGIIFGKQYDTDNCNISNILAALEEVVRSYKVVRAMTFLDFFPASKYFPFHSIKKLMGVYLNALEIVRMMLKERELVFDPVKPPTDLMEALLHARNEALAQSSEDMAAIMSEDHLINTINDMFFAGYETTTDTLRWAIGFLVQNPTYQRDIQAQLDEVVAHDRMPCLDDRPNLQLVHATIMETLRLGNIAPQAIPHCVLKDTYLCGYRVPKGAVVFPDLEAVHLDPKCWENPTVFNPYRHIDEQGKLITDKGNFFPFGAGRRTCSGEPLAKMELFMFLSWMLHRFTFEPAEGQDPLQLKPLRSLVQYPAPYKIRAIKRK